MPEILYKKECFQLMGIFFDIHNQLGGGFSEIVYKDALEYELKVGKILYEREKEYVVTYKDIILKHKFFADFVVVDKIIIEIKSCDDFSGTHISQCLNYLKVSHNKLALLINFQKEKLQHKRIIF